MPIHKKDIKTIEDLEDYAYVFYQRAINLNRWIDEKLPIHGMSQKIIRASEMWSYNASRAMQLSREITELRQIKTSKITEGFPIGGISE